MSNQTVRRSQDEIRAQGVQGPRACTQRGLRPPRLGFVGVGWIGRHRLEAIAQAQAGHISAVYDTSPQAARAVNDAYPDTQVCESLVQLLKLDLDGIVLATPSALHADQAVAALEAGRAVFCQKPLARTYQEARTVIEAAQQADRLLGVDFSYRCVAGVPQLRELIQTGALGEIYAVELVFHNAYGPDKSWFYDVSASGGGCVMDLGIHLVDLALWCLDFPAVVAVDSRLYGQGRRLNLPAASLEDYAVATLTLDQGATVRLACSWRLPVGRDAVIGAAFYGTQGGAALANVNGSFYDFTVERFYDTRSEILGSHPDAWGGRAALAWASQLAQRPAFDPKAWQFAQVSTVIDRLYGR